MRRHPYPVPRSHRRAFVLVAFVVLVSAVGSRAGRAAGAVIVGADGKATRAGVPPTGPVPPALQSARKFGRRLPEPGITPAPAPPSATNPIVTGTAEAPGEKEFNSCRKF